MVSERDQKSGGLADRMDNYVHLVGEQVTEFQGHKLTDDDHKLAQLAGVWHNLDAYNDLLGRHENDEQWVMNFLFHKYGDLIYRE